MGYALNPKDFGLTIDIEKKVLKKHNKVDGYINWHTIKKIKSAFPQLSYLQIKLAITKRKKINISDTILYMKQKMLQQQIRHKQFVY